jgi:hypothetical protein
LRARAALFKFKFALRKFTGHRDELPPQAASELVSLSLLTLGPALELGAQAGLGRLPTS